MASQDEEKPRPKPIHAVGEPLEALSVGELGDRIALLQEEIARLEAARAQKQAAQAVADALFKK
jgi:uncharacterized small protein (DUF1192 family)